MSTFYITRHYQNNISHISIHHIKSNPVKITNKSSIKLCYIISLDLRALLNHHKVLKKMLTYPYHTNIRNSIKISNAKQTCFVTNIVSNFCHMNAQ